VALGLALAVTGWPRVRKALRHHSYFAVHDVVVRGRTRLAPDEIRTLAGIEPGISIWDVDCHAAEERLLARPWVRSATVRRELPHRVVIQLREERPVAILAVASRRADPVLYFVARHGRLFGVARGDARDFPFITGLTPADVTGGDAFGPRAVRRALALLRVAGRSRSVESVSEIHVDRVRGLTLLPVRPQVPIELGWGGFAPKLARLPKVFALWAGRETEIASVSLLFDDDVIVRTRAPKPAVGSRRAGV
jgi:cell division protein FtsQ